MAEFQWWLLIVGLVAGGGLVAVVQMDGRRRDEDIAGLERQAEANWIVNRLSRRPDGPDARLVNAVLRLHREYLQLPPPDRLVIAETGEDAEAPRPGSARPDPSDDGDPDHMAHDVRDDRGRRPDHDLTAAGEDEAPPREEAHAGADREQRPD